MAHESFQSSDHERFGAGLTEVDVRRFQTILHEQCRLDIGLPEAWARAIELLSLVELLSEQCGVIENSGSQSPEFASPRS